MVVYDNELKQRETKDKIEPQHMQLVGENINTQDVLLALIAFFFLIVHGGHATWHLSDSPVVMQATQLW